MSALGSTPSMKTSADVLGTGLSVISLATAGARTPPSWVVCLIHFRRGFGGGVGRAFAVGCSRLGDAFAFGSCAVAGVCAALSPLDGAPVWSGKIVSFFSLLMTLN